MLASPPPGYNASAVNRQSGPFPNPGAQGTSVLGPSRQLGFDPTLPTGGVSPVSLGGVGNSSLINSSNAPGSLPQQGQGTWQAPLGGPPKPNAIQMLQALLKRSAI